MKIFQIGFNKCGTHSFYHFFKNNKIPSCHWLGGLLAKSMKKNHDNKKPLLSDYDQFTFYSDMEKSPDIYGHILYYKELDKQYPGSKFILNIRNQDDWIISRSKHFNYLQKSKDYLGYKTNEQVFDFWRKQWYEHIINVLLYFKNRPDDLLVFDIDKDNIAKLIRFFPDLKLDSKHWCHNYKTIK